MSEAKEHSANGRRGHETRDVSVGNLAAFGLILLGLIILGSLVSWVVRNYLYARQSLGPAATPFENVRQEPPGNRPELQTRPAEELVQFSKKQRQALASYGWVDEKAGVARIPIERAMAILLQRGFPTESSAAKTAGALPVPDRHGKKRP